MQDDVLLHNLTVRETFIIAAKLRLPPAMGWAAKQQVVEDIITELGLSKAANTQIGTCQPPTQLSLHCHSSCASSSPSTRGTL